MVNVLIEKSAKFLADREDMAHDVVNNMGKFLLVSVPRFCMNRDWHDCSGPNCSGSFVYEMRFYATDCCRSAIRGEIPVSVIGRKETNSAAEVIDDLPVCHFPVKNQFHASVV